MKLILSRVRMIAFLILADLVVAGLFFYLLLSWLEGRETYIRVLWIAVAGCFFVAIILSKYLLIYRQLGRDDVTGGNNRRQFERLVKNVLSSGHGYVMVHANIDRFKLINDAYGDEEGDRILKKIHQIIDDELGWDEVSGRLMADNFGILMHYHSIAKLDERLERISDRFAELSDANGTPYGISMFYGVYVIDPKEDLEVGALLERANLGRKNITFNNFRVPLGVYDDKDRQRMNRDRELEKKMHSAMAHGDFIPYLQPKVDLESDRIAGAEALIRWMDPEEGMIYPAEFIPLFEKNGFVINIDIYMFEEVCKMVDRWNQIGYRIIPISVNLSRCHFEVPEFFEYYEAIYEKYDIPKGAIEIELTESLFYNDLNSLNDLVTRIHKLGMTCSIDDFGSGYSSLNMLKDVRVDTLKLDRVFFKSSEDDARGKDVIRSVINLAQALDLKTVSEGVEINDQVEFLRDMNCDLIQGYVFFKPLSIREFEKLAFA
ncbi:MAG: GGDEF domain-containing protein [Eubacterium sp.]|nr:GGDEF domain-containing protein [Eubacterium sp.]